LERLIRDLCVNGSIAGANAGVGPLALPKDHRRPNGSGGGLQ